MSTLQLDSLPVSAASKPNPTFTRIKPPPVFGYRPSPDGVDTNLLILLHGLGDTDKPFLALGTRLNLPQTAILALRAFERVPLLEEDCFQWWDSFDILTGLPLSNPNPSSALNKLIEILDVLISKEIGWEPQRIHLFGFGQGGSCVAELALLWNRVKPNSSNLGSLVSISGPLLSLPTIEPESCSSTPTLLWQGKGEDPIGKWPRCFERGFKLFQQHIAKHSSQEQMPTTPEEWQPILKFWSQLIQFRQPWEIDSPSNDKSTFSIRSQS